MKSEIPQTVEWREATAQMNKTSDTMKMDLGQNILEKSLLIFSEAKASWVYTRLSQKKMPKPHRMHALIRKIASKLKQSLIISRVLMTSPWASKSVKQIDDAFSICEIAASPKGANASFKSCTVNRRGPPLYPTRWYIRGSWQLVKCLCCLWNSA